MLFFQILIDKIYKSFQEKHWQLFSMHRRVEAKENTLVRLLNQAFLALSFKMFVNDRTYIVDAVAQLNENY